MPTLWLLRHAKSAWDDPALEDHERPLAPRGERACEVLRAHVEGKIEPDVVVCSTALRARQTLQRVFPDLDEGTVRFASEVYEAPVERLRVCIEQHAAGAKAMLLVGHNPGLQALALWLAAAPRRVNRGMLERLREKCPTGALVTLEVPDLAALCPGGGELRDFVTPKRLAGE